MIKLGIIKILSWLLGKENTPPLKKEEELGLLAQLYSNVAFRTYLNTRENYLVLAGIDKVMNNKMEELKGLAGQILEVRRIRSKTRAAHLIVSKQSLKKGNEKS